MTDATTNAAPSNEQKLADKASEAKDAFKQRATEAADQIRTVVGERATAARDWATDQSDVLRDTVQTRPFISVGVSAGTAFAAGLVLGILLTRR